MAAEHVREDKEARNEFEVRLRCVYHGVLTPAKPKAPRSGQKRARTETQQHARRWPHGRVASWATESSHPPGWARFRQSPDIQTARYELSGPGSRGLAPSLGLGSLDRMTDSVQTVPKPRKILCGLFVRREAWVISRGGRLAVLIALVVGLVAFFQGAYPFLAVNNGGSGGALVVEGWISTRRT